jgi:hypothetical protein
VSSLRYYSLPTCPVQGFTLDQYEIRDDGQIIWNFKVPPGATIFSTPEWLFSANTGYAAHCRFTARVLQQGTRRWVEVGDLSTGTFYSLPDELANTLPPNLLDPTDPDSRWNFWISTAPNDQTWVVRFQGGNAQSVVYLFHPADQHWTLAPQSNPDIDKVTWSPDSQRIAFFQQLSGSTEATLYAITADGSRLWDLGDFPSYENPTWEKCGGIEAVLRGD